MINLKKIYISLTYIGIILWPIQSIDSSFIPGPIQGIFEEAALYPIVLSVILWLWSKVYYKERIYIPDCHAINALYFFVGIVLLNGVINFDAIYNNCFREVFGLQKYVVLVIAVFWDMFLYIFFINIFMERKNFLYDDFRKLIYITTTIAILYSLFEVLAKTGIDGAKNIIESVDSVIRASKTVNAYELRLHSICLEPSMLGFFEGIVLPWILSDIFYKKRRVLAGGFFVLLIIMNFLSMSRSMYVIFWIEIILFIILYRKKISLKIVLQSCMMILLIVIGLSSNMASELMSVNYYDVLNSLFLADDESTIARYGSQAIAFNIFLSHPVWGCGFGQYPFLISEYAPSWVFESIEISNATLGYTNGLWPLIHGLYVRFLAELGILGLAGWLSFIWAIIYYTVKKLNMYGHPVYRNFVLSLSVMLIFGFMHNTFSSVIIWILLAFGTVIAKVIYKEDSV